MGKESGLGFEAYHKILDEAIQALKETEFKSLFEGEEQSGPLVKDCVLETDLELLIPENYIQSITERLALYTQLDDLKSEEELAKFRQDMQDRFGAIPKRVEQLMESVRLRWLAEHMGFEKLVLKDKAMRGNFIANPQSPFYQSDLFGKIIAYVGSNPKECSLKEKGNRLVLRFEQVPDIRTAVEKLERMMA